jgi:hypothetical protein
LSNRTPHFRRIDRPLLDDKLSVHGSEYEVPVPTRRKFTLILSLLALAACGSDEDTLAGCDGVGAVSSVNDGHSHTVCVPAADLARRPTVSILYTTSLVMGHTHQITLTPEQIATLAEAGTVEVITTVDAGHSHTFTLGG